MQPGASARRPSLSATFAMHPTWSRRQMTTICKRPDAKRQQFGSKRRVFPLVSGPIHAIENGLTAGKNKPSGEQLPRRSKRFERFLPQSRNDCCRNRHVCLHLRRGTCVAVGRCATGNAGWERGTFWFNGGSARFRLESPRWFWGSSSNRRERRQGRQTHC